MASTRRQFFENLSSILGGLANVNTNGHGPEWPDLTDYAVAALPLVWIKHADDEPDYLVNKMRHEELFSVRFYYIDWEVPRVHSTYEDWVESVVEEIASDKNVGSSVDFTEVLRITNLETEFPILGFEIEVRAVYHTSQTDI